VSPGAAAVTAAEMVDQQPAVPPWLTQRVAAEADVASKASAANALDVILNTVLLLKLYVRLGQERRERFGGKILA
jgi:hypothetical protein